MTSVEHVVIKLEVVTRTLDVLRHFGSYGCEGLVLWVGEVNRAEARVTNVVVPDQRPVKSESGVGYFVEADTLFELNKDLANSGLRLIAQVHSHPHEAYHSAADDRYAIVTADGGLSLVVPEFGSAPPDPAQWAVYRLRNGSWCELDDVQARALLSIGARA